MGASAESMIKEYIFIHKFRFALMMNLQLIRMMSLLDELVLHIMICLADVVTCCPGLYNYLLEQNLLHTTLACNILCLLCSPTFLSASPKYQKDNDDYFINFTRTSTLKILQTPIC